MEKIGLRILFALIILVFLGLTLPMARYAAKVGEKPPMWLSPLVMAWGFLWVLLSRVDWTWFTDGYTFWWKWSAFFILALGIYVGFWWRLRIKGKKNIANRIDEIGSKNN